MTTTEPTTGADIYSLLEHLPQAQVGDHTRAWIDRVEEITTEVGNVLMNAKDVLAMHEAQAAILLDDLKAALPEEAEELDDGLHELMGILSGSRELYRALSELADIANPDKGGREALDEARERIKGGEGMPR